MPYFITLRKKSGISVVPIAMSVRKQTYLFQNRCLFLAVIFGLLLRFLLCGLCCLLSLLAHLAVSVEYCILLNNKGVGEYVAGDFARRFKL